MLEVEAIEAGYGPVRVLRGLGFSVGIGEILCLTGRNGAGKTTALRAVMGLLPLTAGQVRLGGTVVSGLPAHRVPRLGLGYVPQGRRLFGPMTVAENLEIGLQARGGRPPRGRQGALAHALARFPRLRERLGQRADTLSGGEQQMLAIARALCLEPRVLLLDEPTEGLQPSMIAAIRDVVKGLKDEGVAVVLVEQRIEAILSVADRVAFVEGGRVRETVAAAALGADPALLAARLGV
ncbi:MAG: ABC transporter ATP-binding protein [Rhodobacteraceae bacterium]|nr:ABC transporter ATP-binding protein [Paracoccaceae bacterium]